MSEERGQDLLNRPARKHQREDDLAPLHEAGGTLERRLSRAIDSLRHDEAGLVALLAGLPPVQRLRARLVVLRQMGSEHGARLCGQAYGPSVGPYADALAQGRQEVLAALARPGMPEALQHGAPLLMTPLMRAAEQRGASIYRQRAGSGPEADLDQQADHPAVREALRRAGGGEPLPDSLRRQMEERLGTSLMQVRVHTDRVAAQAAQAVRARAFTVGQDIFFAEGAFSSGDAGGQLLLHELTHVVQYQQGRVPSGGGPTVSQPGDPLEREAESAAQGSRPAQQRLPEIVERVARPAVHLQRDPDPAQAQAPAQDAAAPGGNTGGSLSPIRTRAQGYLNKLLDDIKKKNGQIISKSDGGTPDSHQLFIDYTGTSQETMAANWATPQKDAQGNPVLNKDGTPKMGFMTACNGLTGTYASKALGLSGLGVFQLEHYAPHAYVKADSGGEPKYGDICKHKKFHVFVSLGDQGRVEAGQGGPKMGYDIIKYNPTPYTAADLEGWIDIDKQSTENTKATVAKIIAKLPGTWRVHIGQFTWDYKFTAGSNVVTSAGAFDGASPATGTWAADEQNVTIQWASSGNAEVWRSADVIKGSGKGSNAGQDETFKKQ